MGENEKKREAIANVLNTRHAHLSSPHRFERIAWILDFQDQKNNRSDSHVKRHAKKTQLMNHTVPCSSMGQLVIRDVVSEYLCCWPTEFQQNHCCSVELATDSSTQIWYADEMRAKNCTRKLVRETSSNELFCLQVADWVMQRSNRPSGASHCHCQTRPLRHQASCPASSQALDRSHTHSENGCTESLRVRIGNRLTEALQTHFNLHFFVANRNN